ncbi:hypothetical protein C8J57DRAFT_1546249 [Mycena rebaudengoi]|nr:hypothetical protein C8J57DRAFT_1546249 [Mycena rebaudengoi]
MPRNADQPLISTACITASTNHLPGMCRAFRNTQHIPPDTGLRSLPHGRWPPTGPTPPRLRPFTHQLPHRTAACPANCPFGATTAQPNTSVPLLRPRGAARTDCPYYRAHMRSLLICYSLHLNTTDPSAPAAPAASRRQRAPLDAHPGPTHSGSCHSACLAYRPHPLIHVASRPHWYLCVPPNASFHVRPAGITSARLYAHASGKPTTAISP